MRESSRRAVVAPGRDRYPQVAPESVAWISTEQMREIDRIMIEDLHIELLQMMENAGRHLASLANALFAPRTVTVYAGGGGNGGGGLVAARHLANSGVEVQVVLAAPADRMSAAASHQLDIVQRMGIEVSDAPARADIAIDALIGYGLVGGLRGKSAQFARAMPTSSAAIVSLDAPSGLDTTTGAGSDAAVHADATITLALPKIGLDQPRSVGDLYLADISVPPAVTERIGGIPGPPFGRGPILRVLRRTEYVEDS